MGKIAVHGSLKWLSVAVLSIWIVGWLLSGWWSMLVVLPATLPDSRVLTVRAGCLWVEVRDMTSIPETQVPPGIYLLRDDYSEGSERFLWKFLHLRRGIDCFVIPMWAIALLVAVPSAMLWQRVVRREIRRRRGQCLGCGYDRRATPAGAVCPECGAASAGFTRASVPGKTLE